MKVSELIHNLKKHDPNATIEIVVDRQRRSHMTLHAYGYFGTTRVALIGEDDRAAVRSDEEQQPDDGTEIVDLQTGDVRHRTR